MRPVRRWPESPHARASAEQPCWEPGFLLGHWGAWNGTEREGVERAVAPSAEKEPVHVFVIVCTRMCVHTWGSAGTISRDLLDSLPGSAGRGGETGGT